MTVAELIEKLKEFPPGLRVLVDGYESGMSEPGEVCRVTARESGYGPSSYLGEFEIYDDDYPSSERVPFEAVRIPR
jgi:hypothetical protein